ncbi:hypothetical protein EYC80_006411 [Monilinia laxa]|uniref:Ubiquitin-like domain-containing protein n=1 Tax=Monilinia laxa TaxID=61186 RepID=A0A5N6JUJ1_MONLA|nr:hypothetical protein EYC80_006411 [Monilinia laxa]
MRSFTCAITYIFSTNKRANDQSIKMSSPTRDPVTPTREKKPESRTGSGTGAEAEKAKTISITVADQAGTELTFKIKRVRPLSKLIEAYCQHKEMNDSTIMRFFYDGIRIQDGDTAEDLKMDDEGRIDVHLFQDGGGAYE